MSGRVTPTTIALLVLGSIATAGVGFLAWLVWRWWRDGTSC